MIANKKIDFRHVVKQPESQTLEICSFTLTLALTKGQKMALGKGSRKKAPPPLPQFGQLVKLF